MSEPQLTRIEADGRGAEVGVGGICVGVCVGIGVGLGGTVVGVGAPDGNPCVNIEHDKTIMESGTRSFFIMGEPSFIKFRARSNELPHPVSL